jgi:transcriptional regulator with PAS, ATPase and Fis domain
MAAPKTTVTSTNPVDRLVGRAVLPPNSSATREVDPMISLGHLIGDSAGIVSIREQIRRLTERQSDARRPLPILIVGETGTGKGLVACAIHATGPRAHEPFVQVNCAAVPETLFEAELFGFAKGAFTGASHAKAGLFQAAARGTIFLDEVSCLPLTLQAKLLKVVEQRTMRRIGSTREEPMDAWIIAASSDDLLARTREGRFREDLYHRLAVVSLQLPPLRQRGRDILLLAERFLAHACAEYGVPARTLALSARAALLAHPWPGNVRELSNLMERVVLLSEETQVTAETLESLEPRLPEPAAAPGSNGKGYRGMPPTPSAGRGASLPEHPTRGGSAPHVAGRAPGDAGRAAS